MHIDNHLNVNGLNALAKRHKLNRYKNKTCIHAVWASLAAQLVKNLPAMPKSVVQFLSWEDPLQKG